MKHYLVAMIEDNYSPSIAYLQKNLSRRYKLYKNTPVLHIPLGVINSNDTEKLIEILSKIFAPYKKFKVSTNNEIVFNESSNTVGLKVTNEGYINKIHRNIFDTLALYNIPIKEFNNSTLNIPLANSNHSIRKLISNNGFYINQSKSLDDYYSFVKVTKFELWKHTNNKDIIKSFILKDY